MVVKVESISDSKLKLQLSGTSISSDLLQNLVQDVRHMVIVQIENVKGGVTVLFEKADHSWDIYITASKILSGLRMAI